MIEKMGRKKENELVMIEGRICSAPNYSLGKYMPGRLSGRFPVLEQLFLIDAFNNKIELYDNTNTFFHLQSA